MVELVQENWILLVVALLVGLLVAWWLFAASRKTKVEIARPDAEPQPARRNQALIDAPPAAAVTPASVPPAAAPEVPPATPAGLAGAGEAVAAAAAVAEPVPMPQPVAPSGDDLTRIKGLGPKLAEQLRALGVTSFDQIASWSEDDIERIDAQLGRFQGRIRRDSWPEQARLLSAGDTAAYEAQFGRL